MEPANGRSPHFSMALRVAALPVVTIGAGLCLVGYLAWQMTHSAADREIQARGAGLLSAVDAIRITTEDRLAATPGDPRNRTGARAAEAAAAAADQKNQGVRYKLAMLNPMAAHRKPSEWEGRAIASLDLNRSLRRVTDRVTLDGRTYTAIATPVAVRQEACLRCHSRPTGIKGPRALLPWPGKNWKVGRVVGASVVYVPSEPPHAAASAAFWGIVRLVAAVLALGGVVVGCYVWGSVVRPADRLLEASEALRRSEWKARFDQDSPGQLAPVIDSLHGTTRWLRARLAAEEKLRALFQQFVPAGVAARALGKDSADIVEGMQHAVSVMVVNVRNFHLLKEGLSPNDTITQLNEVFACINRAVVANNGMVSKYLGDTVLAVFGVPVGSERFALDAVKAALAVPKALQDLYLDLDERHGWQLGVGIGVSTGDALVGHFGSEEHMEYTVLGDVVPFAHKLEDLTRSVPEEDTICIDENTYRMLMSDVHVYDMGERTASDGTAVHAYVVQGFRSEARAALAA